MKVLAVDFLDSKAPSGKISRLSEKMAMAGSFWTQAPNTRWHNANLMLCSVA